MKNARVATYLFLLRVAFPLLFAFSGCASRQATIARVTKVLDASYASFEKYDDKRQAEIVDAARSLDEGRAALAAHRATRDKVNAAFVAAYGALVAASLDASDVNMTRLAELAGRALAAFGALGAPGGGP